MLFHKKARKRYSTCVLHGVPAGARTQNCNLGGCCVILLRYGNILKKNFIPNLYQFLILSYVLWLCKQQKVLYIDVLSWFGVDILKPSKVIVLGLFSGNCRQFGFKNCSFFIENRIITFVSFNNFHLVQ